MDPQDKPKTDKPDSRYLNIQDNLNLNKNYCYHTVYTGSVIEPNEKFKQLYFQFQVQPLQSIRLENHNRKKIIKLILGDLQLQIYAIKSNQQFIYQQGIYKNFIVTDIIWDGKRYEIGKKEVKIHQWTSLTVTIQSKIQFKDKSVWALQNCFPVIQIGSQQPKEILDCKIKCLSLSLQKLPQGTTNKQTSLSLQCGPLDTIPTSQIPPIDSVQQYSSPQCSASLYFCHDMAGGYKQDINQTQPYPLQSNKYSPESAYKHSYRCLHLAQASIFNYFSHHLVTIPTLHWRRICAQARVKCLGTYIVQKDTPKESQYLSEYTVDMLVYFCKRYRFDGYLLNFQHNIQQPQKLLIPWLKKLVDKIHKAVPGSVIIWYDSVVQNGQVSYQNQVNEQNQIYYQICDGFFTNYWWNQEKIRRNLYFKIQGKPIYVGSDCFGRNTYGGGGYNTYKAVNKIRETDNGQNALAPALFAMGYTYQFDQQNVQKCKINEKSMYRGQNFSEIQLDHSKWLYLNQNEPGCKWQFQNDWAITSFSTCRRVIGVKIFEFFKKQQQNSSVQFSYFTTIQGTEPNCADFYRITLLLKMGADTINEVTTGQCTASQRQQIIELKMLIDPDLITSKTIMEIRVEGKDAQRWAGHYGTKFKDDTAMIIQYYKQNDWSAKFKTNFPKGVPLPYLTNYNVGHGYNFHVRGQKIKKSYNYMSDMDMCFGYLENHPLNVNIYYNDAYMGGTCLLVQNRDRFKLMRIEVGKNKQIYCRFVVKNLGKNIQFDVQCKLGKQSRNAKQLNSKKLQNSWVQYNYMIELEQKNLKQQNPEQSLTVYLTHQQNCRYLIGQTAFYVAQQQAKKQQISALTELVVRLSAQNPPVAPLFITVQAQFKSKTRILLTLDNFACFGWADQLNGYRVQIQNIRSKGKSNSLSIHQLNSQMQYTQTYKQAIDLNKLGLVGQMKLI